MINSKVDEERRYLNTIIHIVGKILNSRKIELAFDICKDKYEVFSYGARSYSYISIAIPKNELERHDISTLLNNLIPYLIVGCIAEKRSSILFYSSVLLMIGLVIALGLVIPSVEGLIVSLAIAITLIALSRYLIRRAPKQIDVDEAVKMHRKLVKNESYHNTIIKVMTLLKYALSMLKDVLSGRRKSYEETRLVVDGFGIVNLRIVRTDDCRIKIQMMREITI